MNLALFLAVTAINECSGPPCSGRNAGLVPCRPHQVSRAARQFICGLYLFYPPTAAGAALASRTLCRVSARLGGEALHR